MGIRIFKNTFQKQPISGSSLEPNFEMFLKKDFQPNLEVFAKIEIFTLFVWLDF